MECICQAVPSTDTFWIHKWPDLLSDARLRNVHFQGKITKETGVFKNLDLKIHQLQGIPKSWRLGMHRCTLSLAACGCCGSPLRQEEQFPPQRPGTTLDGNMILVAKKAFQPITSTFPLQMSQHPKTSQNIPKYKHPSHQCCEVTSLLLVKLNHTRKTRLLKRADTWEDFTVADEKDMKITAFKQWKSAACSLRTKKCRLVQHHSAVD